MTRLSINVRLSAPQSIESGEIIAVPGCGGYAERAVADWYHNAAWKAVRCATETAPAI